MADKKYTDEEVIKALECCKDCCCKQCDEEPDFQKAINLINRQKAEIEKLKSNYNKLCEYAEKKELELTEINADISWFREAKFSRLAPAIKEIKVEAYKEFAEKLSDKAEPDENHYWWIRLLDIDNLLKEMVGEEE